MEGNNVGKSICYLIDAALGKGEVESSILSGSTRIRAILLGTQAGFDKAAQNVAGSDMQLLDERRIGGRRAQAQIAGGGHLASVLAGKADDKQPAPAGRRDRGAHC